MDKEILFALDIGTRSIVGIVGEKVNKKVNILAIDRQEHQTRAMLDGQIHDVPQVSQTISEVRDRLMEKTGFKLSKASVAAAGRALLTITAGAAIDTSNILALDAESEQALELAAVQAAQRKLAADSRANDPTGYYCVGYSVIEFKLDGSKLSTLVGQRGKVAEVNLIATFLPRPVIDSMQSALASADLEMGTITLEPIAAINVLIPSTMRHLNLALVDIGAGTSDVAITSGGSVIGYGMVPCAGDEITECISQKYLLDFNEAERVKRLINDKPKKIEMSDVLGGTTQITHKELMDAIRPNVKELGELITKEILALNNNNTPQAVLLIGGGSLTPLLPELVAETMNIPPEKVAVRMPAPTTTLPKIPAELQTPEAITPLGIICLTNSENLNFITIKMNKQIHRLFNLGSLRIADALLSSNIDVNTITGKPGMGMAIEVNGQTRILPGTHGTPGSLELNGKTASLDDKLQDGDKIKVTKGSEGKPAKARISDVADCSSLGNFYVNGKKYNLEPLILLNGKLASASAKLSDRDKVQVTLPANLGQAFKQAGIEYDDSTFEYTINNNIVTSTAPYQVIINGQKANMSAPVKPGDVITIEEGERPALKKLLELDSVELESIDVMFNGEKVQVERTFTEIFVNGKAAKLSYVPTEDDKITFKISKKTPIVSDVLLAGKFDPASAVAGGKIIEILLNGEKTEFTAPIKSGDSVEITSK